MCVWLREYLNNYCNLSKYWSTVLNVHINKISLFSSICIAVTIHFV